MKQRLFVPTTLAIILLVLVGSISLAQEGDANPSPDLATSPDAMAAAVDISFTYQGSLLDNGDPVNDTCDFVFGLWDALEFGHPEGTNTRNGVDVVDGLFTVSLDFEAAAFQGNVRWLQIEVDCTHGGSVVLSPRQPLTAAPYALGLRPGAVISGAVAAEGVLTLENSSGDGLRVTSAGSPSNTYSSTYHNGIEVQGAEGNGLYVGRADRSGVYVNSAGGDGVVVDSAGSDGVYVNSAGSYGLHVSWAGSNGVYVYSAGDDGVQVISAGDIGVYADTTQSSHEWGFYTPDKIYAGSSMASGGPLLFVAQNGGESGLETGDVVAVSGMGAPFGESDTPTPLVQRAGTVSNAPVFGVVYGRFVLTEKVKEVERDGRIEQRTSLRAGSAEGQAGPGEYMLVVVMGAAQVKVESLSGNLYPGALLAVDGGGRTMMADATTTPFGAIVGTAMEAPDTAKDGLIWVLVNPR